jgi:hypothetical protein
MPTSHGHASQPHTDLRAKLVFNRQRASHHQWKANPQRQHSNARSHHTRTRGPSRTSNSPTVFRPDRWPRQRTQCVPALRLSVDFSKHDKRTGKHENSPSPINADQPEKCSHTHSRPDKWSRKQRTHCAPVSLSLLDSTEDDGQTGGQTRYLPDLGNGQIISRPPTISDDPDRCSRTHCTPLVQLSEETLKNDTLRGRVHLTELHAQSACQDC